MAAPPTTPCALTARTPCRGVVADSPLTLPARVPVRRHRTRSSHLRRAPLERHRRHRQHVEVRWMARRYCGHMMLSREVAGSRRERQPARARPRHPGHDRLPMRGRLSRAGPSLLALLRWSSAAESGAARSTGKRRRPCHGRCVQRDRTSGPLVWCVGCLNDRQREQRTSG